MLHMGQHVGGEALARGLPGLIRCIDELTIAFQRELGVDHDRTRWVGQFNQAVGPASVAEGGLKPVGRRRQRRLYEVLQLDFSECAARLLVRQNVLQPYDLCR